MDAWFNRIEARCCGSCTGAIEELCESGFVVIPGPVPPDRLKQFSEAYDSAVRCAVSDDVATGRSTTRVTDFVNRGAEFDGLYTYEPLLAACCRVIRRPFKLSTMHARTVRPHTEAQ